jgi:hypothetical protein
VITVTVIIKAAVTVMVVVAKNKKKQQQFLPFYSRLVDMRQQVDGLLILLARHYYPSIITHIYCKLQSRGTR